MKHVNDIIDFAKVPHLTKRESRLMDATDQVRQTPPQQRNDLSYWPRGLVQCTLPHSNPGNVRAYLRRSGAYFLMVEPGAKLDPNSDNIGSWGYPYGSYPRLCCSYFAREIRRTKSRRIFLGESLSVFMAELGLVPTGGRWGTITNLRKQILALVNAKIAFGYAAPGLDAGGNQLFADRYVLWWSAGTSAAQGTLFPNFIDISEPLFDDLEKSFPVDMAILRELKQSSLALDLYAFATSKVFNMKSATAITWKSLHGQFGGSYAKVNRFRDAALKHLRVIEVLYPDFKYTLERGRIVVWPSGTSVLP